MQIPNLPSQKQLQLMLEISKKNFICATDKNNNLYHNYFSTFRALENLVENGWIIKKKDNIDKNIYLLSPKGNNLLVLIGLLPLSKLLIRL